MTDLLEVRDLVKRYGERTAVDGLSFRVVAGEVYGLLGPNGAGKTTTVRMVTGLLQPSSGSVLVAGFDPFAEPLAARAHLGWVGDARHHPAPGLGGPAGRARRHARLLRRLRRRHRNGRGHGPASAPGVISSRTWLRGSAP